MTTTPENEIAEAALRVAATQPDGIASFHRLKKEIPSVITLSGSDKLPSKTRNGEPMWHQILRNIKSHDKSDDNYINLGLLKHVPRVGYKITKLGKKHIS